MKAILLYNLYPKTIWKSVTHDLLSDIPHDTIVVNVTMPLFAWIFKRQIKKYLLRFEKVEKIFFTPNNRRQGETPGFDKLRKLVSFDGYDIVTYIHSKGTSRKRKNTQPVKDWTALMRYFVLERLDLCIEAFNQGYYLYGVNLSNNLPDNARVDFAETKFIYEGNFVSLNNKMLGKKFVETECKKNYYGVERFWGCLCEKEKAYCVHYSKTDHYNQPYPATNYINL